MTEQEVLNLITTRTALDELNVTVGPLKFKHEQDIQKIIPFVLHKSGLDEVLRQINVSETLEPQKVEIPIAPFTDNFDRRKAFMDKNSLEELFMNQALDYAVNVLPIVIVNKLIKSNLHYDYKKLLDQFVYDTYLKQLQEQLPNLDIEVAYGEIVTITLKAYHLTNAEKIRLHNSVQDGDIGIIQVRVLGV